MTIEDELRALGFHRAGEIAPVSASQCKFEISSDVAEYAVWVMVVSGKVMMVGKASTGLRKRMVGVASAVNAVLKGRHPRDPFQRASPDLIRAGKKIEVWSKASNVNRIDDEVGKLNAKYWPKWSGRGDLGR